MTDDTLRNFVASLHESIVEAMSAADEEPTDPQYRLGVRKLAKAFFDKLELFEVAQMLPDLPSRDVDAWYAGREKL